MPQGWRHRGGRKIYCVCSWKPFLSLLGYCQLLLCKHYSNQGELEILTHDHKIKFLICQDKAVQELKLRAHCLHSGLSLVINFFSLSKQACPLERMQDI